MSLDFLTSHVFLGQQLFCIILNLQESTFPAHLEDSNHLFAGWLLSLDWLSWLTLTDSNKFYFIRKKQLLASSMPFLVQKWWLTSHWIISIQPQTRVEMRGLFPSGNNSAATVSAFSAGARSHYFHLAFPWWKPHTKARSRKLWSTILPTLTFKMFLRGWDEKL